LNEDLIDNLLIIQEPHAMDKGMPIKSDRNPSFSLVLALFSDFDFDCRQGPRLRPKTLFKIEHDILPEKGECSV